MFTSPSNTPTHDGEYNPLFIEHYELRTKDLVAYHAIAGDNAPSPNEALTDIYFLHVRPFQREYREQERGGSGWERGRQPRLQPVGIAAVDHRGQLQLRVRT